MAADYFQRRKAFLSRLNANRFPPLTRLLAYDLFELFDKHRFPDSLSISDSELTEFTGIRSKQTIFDARRRLKNAGIIDFQSGNSHTPNRYQLKIDAEQSDADNKTHSYNKTYSSSSKRKWLTGDEILGY